MFCECYRILELFQIVHHGQTPPKFTYPKDPFSNDTRWESSLGELSKVKIMFLLDFWNSLIHYLMASMTS